MKAWWTAAELAAENLPGLPATKRNINETAIRDGWEWRPREGRGGGREYCVASERFPAAARVELAHRAQAEAAARLATPEAPAALDSTLAGLAGAKRARATTRAIIVNLLDTFHGDSGLTLQDAMRAFVARWNGGTIPAPADVRKAMPRLAERSVWRWRAKVTSGASSQLAGQYKGRREQGLIGGNPELQQFVDDRVLASPKHVNARHLHREAIARFGRERVPSLGRMRAYVRRYKQENAYEVAWATNPDKAKSRLRPAHGSASEAFPRINQRWEIDATKADVRCVDGRYTALAVIDIATRRAMVRIVRTSKAVAVTSLLANAIDAWGMPEEIKFDNGKEFLSRHVVGAMAAMRIREARSPAFTPEVKPHVERFFGTLTRDLFRRLPGFIGHDVADQQALRARQSFAQRFGGEVDRLDCVELTQAELQREIDTWLAAEYERRPHEGLDASPFEVATKLAHQSRRVGDVRALDVLMHEAPGDGGMRVVGKKGLHVDGRIYDAPALGGLIGDMVLVKYDPEDLGRVVVYIPNGPFVCVAVDPTTRGQSRAEAAAKAHLNARPRMRAALKRGREARERAAAPAAEWLQQQAEAQAKVVAFPAPAEIVTTPALEEAARAARALDGMPELEAVAGEVRQAGPAEIVDLTARLPEADLFPEFGLPMEQFDWMQRHPDQVTDEMRSAIMLERLRDPNFNAYVAVMEQRAARNTGG